MVSADNLRAALEAYTDFAKRLAAGEDSDFEELCRENRGMEAELRELHGVFQLAWSLTQNRSIQESIRQHLGDDVPNITVSLRPELETVASSPEATQEAETPEAARKAETPDPSLGTQIGRYRIERELARGGMGIVFRVHDRDLSRTLAMKVLIGEPAEQERSSMATRIDLARFLEEAQVTAQLDHPGIVPIHDVGFEADGRVYFTMKLVRGRELGKIFELAREEREDWNLPRAVGVLVKVCQAIAFSHAKGVIHRDLKPANIMVGRFGEVYVMDWGLAKIVGHKDLHDLRLVENTQMTFTSIQSERKTSRESSADSPLITMDGSVVGTPAYMSVEQAQGKVEEVDQASDVYAVGAILYNLLAGHPPYVEAGAKVSPHTVLAAVLQSSPKPIHEAARGAPAELLAICEKAMARRREDRYGSSLDLAEDLQAYLDGRVVKAFRTGAVAELKSWVHRNRSTATAAAVAALILVGSVLAFVFVQARANLRIAAERDVARQQHYYGGIALANHYLDSSQVHRAREALLACPAEHRNWEWGYLIAQCHQEYFSFDLNSTEFRGAAFSADNRRMLVLKSSGALEIRSVEPDDNPGRIVASIGLAGDDRVHEFALDWHSRWVATIGPGRGVRLWDVKTGEESEWRLPPAAAGEIEISFHPDGNRLAIGSRDNEITVWDTVQRKLLHTLTGHDDLVVVKYSLDGERLVTRGKKRSIIWDAETGEQLFVARIPDDKYSVDALSPCGLKFAIFNDKSELLVCDARSGDTTLTLPGHVDGIQRFEFRPDGLVLGTFNKDGTVNAWNTETGKEVAFIDARIVAISGSLDFTSLVVASRRRDVTIFGGTGKPVRVLRGHRAIVNRVLMSDDGRRVLTVDESGHCKVWSLDFGRETLDGKPGVVSIATSPDGQKIATGHWDGKVKLWDAETGRLQYVVERFFQQVLTLDFSPDGKWVAAAGGDARVDVFRVEDGRSWISLDHDRLINSVDFSPDSALLVAGGKDRTVRLWEVESGKLASEFDVKESQVYSVQFSPDGSRVATGHGDRKARLWDVATSRELSAFDCGTGMVFRVRFSPDGEKLATANNNTVLLWNLETGELDRSFQARTTVHSIAFQPDGQRLFVVSGERRPDRGYPTAGVWDTATGRELLTFEEETGIFYGLAVGGPTRQLIMGRILGDTRIFQAFPWKEEAYRDEGGDDPGALSELVETYSSRFWRTRVAAELRSDHLGKAPADVPRLGAERSMWPAREPGLDPQLIDLSKFYNRVLTVSLHPRGSSSYDGNDLRGLPTGLVHLANVPFDVRGVVQLTRDRWGWGHLPERVDGITVNRKLHRLHALLGTDVPLADGTAVGGLVFHYMDGASESVDIIYGRDVRSWHGASGATEDSKTNSVEAWNGVNHYLAETGSGYLRIYKANFENPRPAVHVRHVDFTSKAMNSAPFLIALTADSAESELAFYRENHARLVEAFEASRSRRNRHQLASSYRHFAEVMKRDGESAAAAAFGRLATGIRVRLLSPEDPGSTVSLARLLESLGADSRAGRELLPSGANWRYLDDGTIPEDSWRTVDYDDGTWQEGPAPLGYGEGGEATVLRFGGDPNDKQMTTCFRATFEVSDPAPIQFLAVQVLVDDGIVAYLNGEEILRDNLPDGQIDSDTRALRSVEKKSIGFLVPVKSLHRGKNVLAAEIHQWSPTSSDLAFDLEVRADRGIDWVETAKTLEEAGFKLPANLRDEFERR